MLTVERLIVWRTFGIWLFTLFEVDGCNHHLEDVDVQHRAAAIRKLSAGGGSNGPWAACLLTTRRMVGKMPIMGTPADETYAVVAPGDARFPDVQDLISLGDLHKATLGVLPHAAYRQYADDGTIVAAVDGETLLGYSVFADRKTRQDLKLIHLCVGLSSRGRGVARAMVQSISDRYPNAMGIAAYCRRDYAESKVWERLNFAWRGERSGRKKDTVIDGWFRSHGHADLFVPNDVDAQRLIVAIDTNVLSDLSMPDRRPGSADSLVLTADWLEDEIELVQTQAVSAETHNTTDPTKRRQIASRAASIRTLHADDRDVSMLHQRLLDAIGPDALDRDTSLTTDAKVLAQAFIGGADMLVTCDRNAVARFKPTFPLLGEFRIAHPAEIGGQLDRLRRRMTYQPSRLLGTGFSSHPPQGTETTELESLINTADGERGSAFRALLRSSAHAPQQGRESVIIRAPDSTLAAFYTHQADQRILTIPMFRVARSKVEHTLARQIVHNLRRLAVARHCDQVVVTDAAPTRAVVGALSEDGFARIDSGWRAVTMQIVDSFTNVAAATHVVLGAGGQALSPGPLTPQEASQLEARLWPIKITDAPLPTYVVPIQERFALDLLGTQPTLTDRPSDLGLAREHIYYRSPVAIEVHGPGRILWYETRRGQPGMVVACSRLIGTQRHTPSALHEEYGRFGVWKRTQIEQVSRSGIVEALHFADTEVLPHPISWRQLRAQSPTLATIQSPRLVAPALFKWVYQTGHGR